MYCLQCGKKLEDGAKFCLDCGAPTGAAGAPAAGNPGAGQSTPPNQSAQGGFPQGTPPGMEPGAPEKPPILTGKWGGIIAVAVGAAAILLVVVLTVSGLFSGPEGKVKKALVKSAEAYQAAADSVGLPDFTALAERGESRVDVSLWLKELSESFVGSDAAALEGLGARLSVGMDIPGQEMALAMTPFYGSADLVSLYLKAEGGDIQIGSPELTDGIFYGLNTETLGADLVKLEDPSIDEDAVKDLSFNLFTLIEDLQAIYEMGDAGQKALQEAVAALVASLEIEAAGDDTLEVNGYDTDCKVFHVVLFEDALLDFLDVVEGAADTSDANDALIEIVASTGIPEEEVEALEEELRYAADTGEAYDTIKDAIKELGDVELDVYLSGGYIVAAIYEERIDGVDVEIGLYLGGGETYADDLSLQVEVGSGSEKSTLLLTSTGDHTAKSGVFTDETVLEIEESGYSAGEFSSDLRYEPKGEGNNLTWDFDMEELSIKLEGRLTTGKESLELLVEELDLRSYGERVLTLGLEYAIGAYERLDIPVEETAMLSDMTMDDIQDAVVDIQENAYDWAMDVVDEIPEIVSMF